MGSCFSSQVGGSGPTSSKHHIQGAADHTEGIIPSPAPSEAHPNQVHGKQINFVEAPGETPPTYDTSQALSTAALLSPYLEAKQNGVPFASLSEWDIRIIIDERSRINPRVKDGIRLLSWFLIVVCQACRANTTLCFMNHTNPDMSSFTKQEEEAALFLQELYFCRTAREVTEKLEGDVPEWIQRRDLLQSAATIMECKDNKPEQRHPRLLALIRNLRWELSNPWVLEDMDLDAFSRLLDRASEADQAQPKVVSSLSFTIIREIQRQRKEYDDRRDDITSSVSKRKVIIITGSRLTESEAPRLKRELKMIEGGSSEFSIQVAHIVENDKTDTDQIQQHLDDQNSGMQDIYDYTVFNGIRLADLGIGWGALAKTLFSHIRAFDRMAGRGPKMYGDGLQYSTGLTIALPGVDAVRKCLGQV